MTLSRITILLLIGIAVIYPQKSLSGRLELLHPHVHGTDDRYVDDRGGEKCGFSIAAEARLAFSYLPQDGRNVVDAVLSRPGLTRSIITPSGFFRLHYDSAGANASTYSINELALALDSALNYEVNIMGFPEPVGDNGAGGDNKYDVYVMDIGGYYGYTEPEDEIVAGSGRYYSYMVIDNDFAGFYTTGISAAKVTAAHELHHAIQVSRYILKTNNTGYIERYFYEMTSTAMEEFVFDYVNDYYAYLSDFFNQPDKPITMHSGYDLPHWHMYLQRRFGFGVIRRQWELFKTMSGVDAMEIAISEAGSSFRTEFPEFAAWCYFTGYRSVPGAYFEEGSEFPTVKTFTNMNMTSSSLSMNLASRPLGILYVKIINKQLSPNDTLFGIIVNSDVSGAIDSSNTYFDFNYSVYTYNVNGGVSVAGKYYARLGGSSAGKMALAHVLNGFYSPSTGGVLATLSHCYPSPYSYKKHGLRPLVIPVPGSSVESEAELFIYDLSGDKIYSGNERVYLDGSKKIRWMPADDDRRRLPTGVYLFVVKTSSGKGEGKFVIIN